MKKSVKGVLQIILNAVNELNIGRNGLVSVLKGLKSKNNMQKEFYKIRVFGALFWLNIDEIKDITNQIIGLGFIEVYDWGTEISCLYYIPKLRLSKHGKKILNEGIDIEFFVESAEKKIAKSNTVLESIKLFREYKAVLNVAEFRKLKPATIWDHLETGIKLGLIEKEEIIPKTEAEKIICVREKNPDKRLGELKELFFPAIEWGFLKCALAEKKR